ncbi:MAG TPA: hypothetical protein VF432_26795 [Thermoanaerobaculia bacterium]
MRFTNRHEEWVHRSIDVPVAPLRPGTNDVRIDFDGVVQLDRLQMAFAYERTSRRRAPATSGVTGRRSRAPETRQ